MDDSENIGFIKLHRSLLNDQYFWADKPFAKGQAWVDLLMLAQWKRRKCLINGRLVWLEPGDIYASTRWLAERWGWSKNKVASFLKDLVLGECIKWPKDGTKKGQQFCIISVENWDIYQNSAPVFGTAKGQPRANQGTDKGQPLTQSKEKKKKRKKEIINNSDFVGENNGHTKHQKQDGRQHSHQTEPDAKGQESGDYASPLETVFHSIRQDMGEDDGQ